MAAKRKPMRPKAPATPSFKGDVLALGADFPCERSTQKARELFEAHGRAFVTLLAKHVGSAIPISLLDKVIGPTLEGRPPKLKAHASIKDRTKEE